MKIFKFSPSLYFGANTYLIISDGVGAIIDPAVDYNTVMKKVQGELTELKYIILTHAHFDHMLSLDEWKAKTNATVIVGAGDIPALTDSNLNVYRLFLGTDGGYFGPYKSVKGGDLITLGGTSLRVMETPGHTPGSISLYHSGALFVGDLVFAGGGIGRTDLAGGSYQALMHSISKLMILPDDTTVYSGHGESTTIFEIKG